jgi:hypothetical protein
MTFENSVKQSVCFPKTNSILTGKEGANVPAPKFDGFLSSDVCVFNSLD